MSSKDKTPAVANTAPAKGKSKRTTTLESLQAAGMPLQSPLKDLKLKKKDYSRRDQQSVVKHSVSATGMPAVPEISGEPEPDTQPAVESVVESLEGDEAPMIQEQM